ncbi:MAG: threonine/serine dehydratase [Candidatus Bathyarchaeota archaeon]|nr:threonine/serine dehydratase [Candidatus Bathyarchaeota archaeon]
MVTLQDIQTAQKTISHYAKLTPLIRSEWLSKQKKADIYLKLENMQETHSFKVRGVLNKLLHLTVEEKAKGVVTASAGNHGQAVAFGAKELGFSAKIVVPTNTPQVKVEGIRKWGADLLLFGETYSEAETKAKQLATQEGRLYISPYNDPLIVAGHGTVGLEILQALPAVDAVVVPVGGGGLIAGVSIAVKNLKPKVQVIGVQSEAVPIMYESLKAGRIVPPHRHENYTVAEGLSGSIEEGSITFSIAQKNVDKVMLVEEETIRRAVYLLYEEEGQVVEGSGVVGIAMLLENPKVFAGKTVALVVTGGNIDHLLLECIKAEQNAAQSL